MKKKVLVVDDEVTTVQLLEYVLQKNNFETISVYSGKKALEKAREEKPDLILLDIMMPGMDGIEVCTELKKDPETNTIPIIFLSALGQETDVALGLKKGAMSYITKPFNPSDLLRQIHLLLPK